MLSIFGNLWINNLDKLQHFKDSLNSFSSISDDWVINIRGKYREEAKKYIKSKLGSKVFLFDLQSDDLGWSGNALKMLPKVKHQYLLLWNEDHINLAPQSRYKKIIKELVSERCDYMWYSWWLSGKSRAAFSVLPLKKLTTIDTINVTKKNWKKINKPGYPFYIISMMSILKKSLFRKLLIQDSNMFPFSKTVKIYSMVNYLNSRGIGIKPQETLLFLNRLSGFKFRKFSEITPFNLEREQYRTDMLPLKAGLSKRELFACIEDDLGEPGYSLVSRGLYNKTKKVKNKGLA